MAVPPGNRDSTDATNFAILAKTRKFLRKVPDFPRFLLFSALFSALFTQYTVLSMILYVGYLHSTQIAILMMQQIS